MASEKRSAYSEKLRDPRWQKRRLEILERDGWACRICGDKESTLHVHHRWYEKGAEPWDATNHALVTLCETCHEQETEDRPGDEAELLRLLKRRYFGFELCQIAKVFYSMPHRHAVEVQLTGIAWALSHAHVVDAILKAYFREGCPVPGNSPPSSLELEIEQETEETTVG